MLCQQHLKQRGGGNETDELTVVNDGEGGLVVVDGSPSGLLLNGRGRDNGRVGVHQQAYRSGGRSAEQLLDRDQAEQLVTFEDRDRCGTFVVLTTHGVQDVADQFVGVRCGHAARSACA